MKIIAFLFLLVFLTGFERCTHDSSNPGICFQENILPIFVSNCTQSGCHNSQEKAGEYDFSTYEGILAGVSPKHPIQSEVYSNISGLSPTMPPSPYKKLSSRDVKYIKFWINQGAPNSSNCMSCDSSKYSYKEKIQPILTAWCTGCHSQSNASGGYDFSTYSSTMNKASNAAFLGALEHSPGFSSMPKNSSKLPDCSITAIEKWVKAGFPDN